MADDPFAGFAPAPPDLSGYSDAQLQQMLTAAQAQAAPQQRPGYTLQPVSGDPYAGLGTPAPAPQPAGADPYAGLGKPIAPGADPFAGFAPAPPEAPGQGGPDLSHLSDAQLQAMLDARRAAAAKAAGALTVHGSPQNAGDALDMVEGTGTAAYDTGAPEGGATYGARLRNLGGMAVAGLDGAAGMVPFTDRLAALAAAGTGIGGRFGDYSGNLAQLRGEEGAAMAAHPDAALAGGLIGGAALPLGALGDVSAAAGLGGKVLAGARAGGIIGGLQGASSSPDLGNLPQTALATGTGALAGAGIGFAAPLVGAGAGAAYRGLMAPAVQEAPGVPAAARQMVVQAIRNDDPASVMARLRQLGPDATLSDLGPSLQGIAMGQAVKDGPGASIVLNNLAARQRGASDRVLSDVGQAIGPAQNADALARSIGDVGQAASAPFYARAAGAGVPYSPELASLVQRPAVASALQDAATSAANAGRPLGSITLDAAGNPVSSDAAMQAYEAGTRPAVTDALARLMGSDPNVGPLAAQDALAAQRSAAADPLYQAYRGMNVPMTPELAEVLNRPSVQAAIPAAERKAQDQGRSIYAGPALTGAPQPGGSAEIPDVTAGLGQGPGAAMGPGSAPPPSWAGSLGNAAPQRPTGPAPVSLMSMLQRTGIQDPGGDLAAAGMGRFPGLIRANGMPLDQAREAAAEAGYLGGDTAAAVRNTTPNDLIDALSNHPTYSVHDQDAVAARQAYADWEAGQRAPTGQDLAAEAVRSHLLDNGVPSNSIDPGTLDVAAHLHARGMDPGDAWEAAATAPPFPGDAPSGRPLTITPAQPPMRQLTPEGLDFVKRALDDRIAAAQRGSDPSPDDARIFGGLKSDLLGAIERHPDPAVAQAYGAARAAYAGPSREMDALQAGRAAFGDSVTPEQVQREFGALQTDGERQRYRQGMFAAGSEKLSKAGDASTFVRTVSGNQALRDKFMAVAPNQGAIDAFNGHIARAQQAFTEATRPTPEALRATLGGLDARAVRTGDAGVAAARDDLAGYLGQNPDFARARGIEQDYAGLQAALTAGRTALRGGPTAVHPDDYAAAFSALTAPGQAAQRAGLGDAIYRKLGDTRNDLTAINDVVKGPNDRSRAIIGTTFGQAAADSLGASADREAAFAKTYNDVMQGSMTARRLATQKAQADAEYQPFQLHERHDMTAEGLAYTAAVKPINALLRLFQRPADNTARDIALSRIVTTPGESRNAMLARLLRTQNADDAAAAIGAPVERGVTMAGAVSPAALAAVLRGHQQPGR